MHMNKKQQEVQRKQEDLALKNGLLWVAGAIVLEILLFLLNRYTFHYGTTSAAVNLAVALRTVLKVLRPLGAVAFVGGAVMALLQAKKEKKSVWFLVVSVAGLVVMTCAHVTVVYHEAGMRMLFLLVPVLGGVALSFFLYQREFFLSAVSCVLAALGLWFVRIAGLGLETILVLAAAAVVLMLLLGLKKTDGCLKLAGLEIRLVPEKGNYMTALATTVMALAAVLLAVVAGETIAYYLIFVVGAWLFALLVYYTVKMM